MAIDVSMAFTPGLRRSFAAVAVAASIAFAPAAAHAQLPDPVRFGVVIESGDLKRVQDWLDQGLPADYPADRIGTGLMIAAWEGNLQMMELFVSRGADINRVNAHGEQALMHAAWRGRLEAVKWLLERGAQLNRSGLNWTALHYAVFAGHQEVARYLIDRGANINARSTNGSTPLMMAAYEGKEDLAKLLVELGADTSLKNDRGEDALVWAMRYGHPRIAKLVSTPEQFAAAAKMPREAFGEPVRSARAPDRLETLIEEMRRAQARGQLTVELQNAYLAMVRELRKRPANPQMSPEAQAEVPAALEIRARRDAPGRERAELLYEGTRAPQWSATPAAPALGAENPSGPARTEGVPPIVR